MGLPRAGSRSRFVLLASALVILLVTSGPGQPSGRAATAPAVRNLTLQASARFPSPAYYGPVVSAGKAFPVARSNYLSLIEFPNSWHAPRLRLVNGKWLLIGVHEGIDITAERGTPIVSMEPGVVENVGWTFYSGTRVGVRGVDGRYYLYAHLSKVEPGIVEGARVDAGTILGLVGNTGYGEPGHRDEFPAHLHFGIESNGRWVNPYPSLVSLYAAMVRTTSKWQATLDGLAADGRWSAWRRQAGETYLDLPPA
jgi:murein DD-endopeptidase MepM/ murein hydrolase activator NlpD